jgi:hypothetical protein
VLTLDDDSLGGLRVGTKVETMSKTPKQDALTKWLDTNTVNNRASNLVDEALEEAESRGFDAAVLESMHMPSTPPQVEALKTRYHYLKHGGEWDVPDVSEPDQYAAGFLDAMKTLGVMP